MYVLGWFYPKLAQFIPKPAEPLREVQYPQLDIVFLSASFFFWDTERGRSELDHGFKSSAFSLAALVLVPGPWRGDLGKSPALYRELCCPQLGVLKPMGTFP